MMRKALILVVVCAGLCSALDVSSPRISLAGQHEEGTTGWQYATVRTEAQSRPEILWYYADGRYLKVEGWVDLLAELVPQHMLAVGGSSPASEVAAQGAVLDHLGSLGWELVGVTTRSIANFEGETRSMGDQWVFKRRR